MTIKRSNVQDASNKNSNDSDAFSADGMKLKDVGDGWGIQNDGQAGSIGNPTKVLHPDEAIRAGAFAILSVNDIIAKSTGGTLAMLRPIACTIVGLTLAQVYGPLDVNPDDVINMTEKLLRLMGPPTDEENRLMAGMDSDRKQSKAAAN